MTDSSLEYELRNDGVLYTLGDGVRVKVRRKSASRVRISMQRDKVIIPPETGDLYTSAFRDRLVGLARERFGEVNGLAGELGLIAVGFEAHLEEREEAAADDDEQNNVPEFVGTPYRVMDGGLVRLKSTREGEIPQRLTNFTARVEVEIVKDDGAETRRTFRLSGRTGERELSVAEVPASRFGAMNWIPEHWGLSARIAAGQGTKDFVREAVELLSRSAGTRHTYAHTGWRELPDKRRIFLHAGGAVGAEGVEVELEPGLERYGIPTLDQSAREGLAEAVRCSLGFLELAPRQITAPLLGAAYLAPLSEIVVPDFTLWLWGGTGSFKSTLAALILSHYGDFSETSLPLSFESTSNALERFLFLLKDVPAVVDDWRPAVSRGDASEMDRKAQRLLRATGNRQGRGRMTSDTALRRSYSPRGVVIATAEALPEGPAFEGAAARALSINLSREDVDLEKLSELQQHKAALGRAMTGYIEWVVPRWEELSRTLPTLREELRNTLRPELAGSHPRTPDAAAAMVTGLQTLRAYALSTGALERQAADEFLSMARAGVIEAAKAHAETTKGGDPATRFVEILRSLFDASRAYAKDRETGGHPDDWDDLGWERRETQSGPDIMSEGGAYFVGGVDENHLYLEKDAAYAAVAGFAQRGGIPFGIKPRVLWDALKRPGLSLVEQGRTDAVVRIEGKPKRVVQLSRAAVFSEEPEGTRGDV